VFAISNSERPSKLERQIKWVITPVGAKTMKLRSVCDRNLIVIKIG